MKIKGRSSARLILLFTLCFSAAQGVAIAEQVTGQAQVADVASAQAVSQATAPLDQQVQASGSAQESYDYARIAAEMRDVYEDNLDQLSEDKQRHYVQRLWRLTGESQYLPLNREYGESLLADLASDAQLVKDPALVAQRNQELYESFPTDSVRDRQRKEMFASRTEMMLPRRLLFRLAQAQYHDILPLIPEETRESLNAAVMAVDWRSFLTDPEVISVYAAQVANQVAFLYHLGLMDLREEVLGAFQEQYSPQRVAKLDEDEYSNWLYGLTHIIIARSRYYQRLVPENQVEWILEDFEREAPSLIGRAKEDILAEVALCFLLTGNENHPLVEQIRAHLAAARDPVSGIIPSTTDDVDLELGEHRNVLAIMVFGWGAELTPGPDLSRSVDLSAFHP
ncbi:DUF3541 domain-containing protein [Halomonas binhaiensis]|uniref:DUF3541 domain-containing protein n=1 Tax=Halomonas binhaiensis TaxID=2562282 RepID=A0A856QTB1_9GAMM|nr:DUF3541 domain-containing protein [Halomonas binhaiensis]QEM83126.2 DUF3541 domain-containing protein [Halomonas binhaiensis]